MNTYMFKFERLMDQTAVLVALANSQNGTLLTHCDPAKGPLSSVVEWRLGWWAVGQ